MAAEADDEAVDRDNTVRPEVAEEDLSRGYTPSPDLPRSPSAVATSASSLLRRQDLDGAKTLAVIAWRAAASLGPKGPAVATSNSHMKPAGQDLYQGWCEASESSSPSIPTSPAPHSMVDVYVLLLQDLQQWCPLRTHTVRRTLANLRLPPLHGKERWRRHSTARKLG